VRGALNELSWSLLDCALRAAPRQALMRSAAMAHRNSHTLGAGHRRILDAIEDHADPDAETAGLTAWPAPVVARLH
jgi:hypothetical protein